MAQKLNCIMLVDDNPDDNFFHERVIRKFKLADNILVMSSALEALEYLQNDEQGKIRPNLIFLDINMPGMNGWEFLEVYQKLHKHQQSDQIIVMLTTSENPDDKDKSLTFDFVYDFRTKPLTKETLEAIIARYNDN